MPPGSITLVRLFLYGRHSRSHIKRTGRILRCKTSHISGETVEPQNKLKHKHTHTHNTSVRLPSSSCGDLRGGGGRPCRRPSSCRGRPWGRARSCRSGRTAGASLAAAGGRRAAGWARQEGARRRGQCLNTDESKTSRPLRRILSEQTHLPVIFPANTQLGCLFARSDKHVIDSHIGLLPGLERDPGISCPLRSTHQHCPVLPWHCMGS